MKLTPLMGTRKSDTPLREGEEMVAGVLIRPDNTVSFVGGVHRVRVDTRKGMPLGVRNESSGKRLERVTQKLTDMALAALPKNKEGWATFFAGTPVEGGYFTTSVEIDITDLDIDPGHPHPKCELLGNIVPLPTESGSFDGRGYLRFHGNPLETQLHLDESEAEGIKKREKWIEDLEEEVKRRICKSAGIDYSEDAFGLFLFSTDSGGKIILINPENTL